ncbi:site-specific integrase [Rhodoluna sp.]|uniref:tyrosine-type recombinase/integrase n=1 Tax=Rhodoluna sp. TaxID=1969481 RepID=UPI0025D744A2|nr:site-specific integrase [Rhodoluna sp.]
MARKKTRSYGKGSVYAYKSKAGTRYRWQASFRIDPDDENSPLERLAKGGYESMSLANEAMQLALIEAKKGLSPKTSSEKFGAYAMKWLEIQKLANSTIKGYEKIIRVHLIPEFGSLTLGQIIPSAIAKFYKELETSGNKGRLTKGLPLSANSVNKIHIVLGSILDSAVADGLVRVNQARNNPKIIQAPTGRSIRMQKKELKTWTTQEVNDFLKWNKEVYEDEFYALWHVYCWSGMRRGEGVALQWDDINFDTGVISIRRASDSGLRKSVKQTKTYKERAVLMDEDSLVILRAHKSMRAQLGLQFVRGDSYVFGNLDGTVRNPGDIGEKWSKTLKKAQAEIPDLSHLTIKGIRHTHATLLMEAGVSAKVVQERLGHSNISTTLDIYAHVTPTLQQSAVEALGKYLKGA